MPAGGISPKPYSQILSYEQIHRIVKIATGLGIQKIRLTGGEPLVRKELPLLIEKLKPIKGLKELSLTTNGVYLTRYASSLKKAGLDRVNISLDSLIPERFQKITRGGNFETVLQGIEAAFSAGLLPLKINMVLIKDFNTDEILSFANLARARPIQVRFIEYMTTTLEHSKDNFFFSIAEAKEICCQLGKLHPVSNGASGVATLFRPSGFCGTIGFISPISEPFCFFCNKIRLTSDGKLRSCLYSSKALDLKEAIDKGGSDEELAKLIREAVVLKPGAHNFSRLRHGNLDSLPGCVATDLTMCQIGG
jgi:cyclic pyranopterin phosphate synthase